MTGCTDTAPSADHGWLTKVLAGDRLACGLLGLARNLPEAEWEAFAHAVQRHQRHPPALQLFERGQQVRRAAAPARQLRHQHGVDLAPLREGQHLAALGPVQPHPRGGFLVDADHLVAGPFGKGGQVAFLAVAGLVSGRNAAVQGGALSQLNPPRCAARKPLFPLGSGP